MVLQIVAFEGKGFAPVSGTRLNIGYGFCKAVGVAHELEHDLRLEGTIGSELCYDARGRARGDQMNWSSPRPGRPIRRKPVLFNT